MCPTLTSQSAILSLPSTLKMGTYAELSCPNSEVFSHGFTSIEVICDGSGDWSWSIDNNFMSAQNADFIVNVISAGCFSKYV